MRRRRLRTTLLVVVTAALAGIGYQVATSMRATRGGARRALPIDLPAVAQHIRDFRRVKTRHGKPVWEVKAAEAQYFDDQDAIVVRAPEVIFYFEDGKRRGQNDYETAHGCSPSSGMIRPRASRKIGQDGLRLPLPSPRLAEAVIMEAGAYAELTRSFHTTSCGAPPLILAARHRRVRRASI